MTSLLYPSASKKSLNPCLAYIPIMCQRIGRPPISTMGLGFNWVSSARRLPKPPQRITVFIKSPVQIIEVCDLGSCLYHNRLAPRCYLISQIQYHLCRIHTLILITHRTILFVSHSDQFSIAGFRKRSCLHLESLGSRKKNSSGSVSTSRS